MPEIMEVRDVLAVIRPAVLAMLHPHEAATLQLFLIDVGDSVRAWDNSWTPLQDDDVVIDGSAMARWRILREHGGSGSLHIEGGTDELVAAVQSDLQDFIACSRRTWGELRPLPPR
ncbi:hypothetical protein [Curtobacterium oceanosedimentum]|uniref:Uncharacterized protein n=1 Tax=Curtobacterium oceanosedimentum TaxID=465820 RepID=A0A147DMU5_9MICO|nr:hypothetical protein [Curtobacterium oceanosedimentum]KTR49997.1 hypothetical protein NS359_13990 [Curtobacterium oceanosedimentum]